MKILMVGLGSIGQRHLRNIRRVFGFSYEIIAYRTRRLQVTFSDNMQIREGVDLESEYKLKVYTDLDKALEEKPDIAFITNITSEHMSTAIRCAENGCNLFIEKPLSNSLEGIERLLEIVNEKKLIVFMGFQNRYHVCVKEIKQLLEKNTIGTIQSASIEFSERLSTMHTYEDYRQTYMARSDMGGGPVLNLQIHDLDLLRFLFGKPINVYCKASSNSDLEISVEDNASSIYTFMNQKGCTFPVYAHTDFFQYPPVHMIKIVGEIGRIEVDLNNASIELIVNGDIVFQNVYEDFKRNDMFILELKDFFDAIENKGNKIITLDQGIESLKMAICAKKASERNSVVSIN